MSAEHLVDVHAETVYAGINMDGRAAVPLRAGDKTIPFGEFYQAADHRPRVDLGKGRAAAGQRAIQHIDRGVLHFRTQPARLGEIGDEKRLAAGSDERGADLFDAAAVAVGFHYGGTFHRQRLLREPPPIFLQCRKINREQPARFGLGRTSSNRFG